MTPLRLGWWMFVLGLVTPSLQAQQTFVVDATGGGDFTEIQPAIDAAQDGDRIFVRATGTYAGFLLTKGIVIRASTDPFELEGVVNLSGIVEGLTAGVSGMLSREAGAGTAQLLVDGCRGEIILEDLTFRRGFFVGDMDHSTAVEIRDSGNVSVDGLVVPPSRGGVPVSRPPDPAVVLLRSLVRMSDPEIHGMSGGSDSQALGSEGFHGGTGLLVDHSILSLANPIILGGDGMIGGGGAGVSAESGDGGSGVVVDAAQVLILGREDDRIQGGRPGGSDFYCWSDPGVGGTGLEVLSGSVTVSRVVLVAGECGTDRCGCRDGVPSEGDFQRFDRLASLELTPSLNPGDTYSVDVDATEPGNVLLVVSSLGGWFRLPSFLGPDLSAIPGDAFVVFPLGDTDGAGDLQWSTTLASNPANSGLSWVFQVAILADSGADYLTNSATRVLGQ